MGDIIPRQEAFTFQSWLSGVVRKTPDFAKAGSRRAWDDYLEPA
jgi:hypothetical protein